MAERAVGTVLFETTLPGADRERLRQFSEATEDPNPIHVDEDFAKACGFPTVVQQGPMTTAYFGRLLEEAVGVGRLTLLDVAFTAPVFPDEALTLTATVSKTEADITTCELVAVKADGTVTAKGVATFAS